jgi:hypothetical protein
MQALEFMRVSSVVVGPGILLCVCFVRLHVCVVCLAHTSYLHMR